MEIYNESIRDLLCPEQTDLRIHEDKKKRVYVHPLKEEIVTNPSQVLKLLSKGEINRHVSATDFNLHSSRSHAIFQIIIESRHKLSTEASPTKKARKPDNMVKLSCLVNRILCYPSKN